MPVRDNSDAECGVDRNYAQFMGNKRHHLLIHSFIHSVSHSQTLSFLQAYYTANGNWQMLPSSTLYSRLAGPHTHNNNLIMYLVKSTKYNMNVFHI